MSQLKVTQVRSVIDRPRDQKATVRRLGLHRINDSVIKEDRPEIRGMIAKVPHLVDVEEVDAHEAASPEARRGREEGHEARRPRPRRRARQDRRPRHQGHRRAQERAGLVRGRADAAAAPRARS